MEKTIGVVTGVGPFAGLDLLRNILEQTTASSDQEHLTVLSISAPSTVPDRTAYLEGKIKENPATALVAQVRLLEEMKAEVAAIACNTAHAPEIFGPLRAELDGMGSRIQLLHIAEEVARYIGENFPGARHVGLLATRGTCNYGVYSRPLGSGGLDVLNPEEQVQEGIHNAIYSPSYGIKAMGRATSEAIRDIHHGIDHLKQRGAEVIVLACTELPIAIQDGKDLGLPVIDATFVLARALIREAAPAKLKALPSLR